MTMAVDESWSEIDGGPLANTTSLFSHLEQGLRKNPHDAAVVCIHQPAHHLSKMVPVDDEFRQRNSSQSIECLTLTYTQVHRAALLLAAGMIANGVQPGSTILTLIPNGSEYSVLLWTCTILRLTISSLDPSALDVSGNEDLWRLMEILKPGLVIVPDAAGARVVDNAIEDLSLLKPLRILLEKDGECNTSSEWKTILTLAADASKCHIEEDTLLKDARNDDPNRIHSIFFTSGTSAGQPKGCPQRTSSMTHVLHSQSWLMNTSGHNAAKLVLVQPHNSRAVAPALTLQTWREGATVVMPDAGSFAIRLTLDAINRQGVDFVVLTPAMVHALAQELASSGPTNLDSVSTVHLGGDAVTKDVLTKCAALFPKSRYGGRWRFLHMAFFRYANCPDSVLWRDMSHWDGSAGNEASDLGCRSGVCDEEGRARRVACLLQEYYSTLSRQCIGVFFL
jgi:acyl-CoA synthetase (AMP-forming)/AMP-acid ligase II